MRFLDIKSIEKQLKSVTKNIEQLKRVDENLLCSERFRYDETECLELQKTARSCLVGALFSSDGLVRELRSQFPRYFPDTTERAEILSQEAKEWDGFAEWKHDKILHVHYAEMIPISKFSAYTLSDFFEPLRAYLSRFNKEGFVYPGKIVFVIIRSFDSQETLSKSGDIDKLEEEKLVNVLSREFMKDDAPECMSLFTSAVLSDKPGTDFYLVPEEVFPTWIGETLLAKQA